ncbi:hypothetical protein L513_4384 [Bordetella bronchiseptica MBORD632]|nr:hypothetical protein L513_4384 [Bordetella bronchiseptica MBORD632]
MRQGLGGLRVFPGKHFRHLAIWEKNFAGCPGKANIFI